MKIKLYTSVLVATILFSSCGEPSMKNITAPKTELTKDVSIAEKDLFDGIKIMEFLKNKTKFIQEANEFFLKGINAFKNQNDLDSAEVYLKQSLLKEPSARAYCELGNVYKRKAKYEDALAAYKISEQLDYAPFSNILYNIATVYSLDEKPEEAANYLEFAMQAGFNNLDKIEKDPDLKFLREDEYTYRSALNKGLRGMSDPDKLFWLQFKKQFAKTNMPVTLNWDLSPEKKETLQFISYDFEKYIAEMRDEKFSREVSKGFYFFAQVMETDQFVALIYIVKEEFLGDYAPVTYKLATFTSSGKLIDKREISGRTSLEDEVRLATIKANGAIDVQLLALEHDKDPENEGYIDNPIKSTKIVGKEKYQIKSNGKIEMLSETRISDVAQAVE